MHLLLTSAGMRNGSIADALVGLLGKPVAESTAVYIPTAIHPLPAGADLLWRMMTGALAEPFAHFGWKSVGVVELTALPGLGEESWAPRFEEADAILVGGGDPYYLARWMRESGLALLLPSLTDKVYVGLSAGSLVMTPTYGQGFNNWTQPDGTNEPLGFVDFAIFPHLDHPALPENTMADAERWAETLPVPGYAIDDDTAIKVVDGEVEVVSEGSWRLFT